MEQLLVAVHATTGSCCCTRRERLLLIVNGCAQETDGGVERQPPATASTRHTRVAHKSTPIKNTRNTLIFKQRFLRSFKLQNNFSSRRANHQRLQLQRREAAARRAVAAHNYIPWQNHSALSRWSVALHCFDHQTRLSRSIGIIAHKRIGRRAHLRLHSRYSDSAHVRRRHFGG